MSDYPESPVREDMPEPELVDLQQRDLYERAPAVPVRQVGAVTTHELPSRAGVVFSLPLTTTPQNVVGADLSRKRLTLLADAAFMVSHSSSGAGAPWPANVSLVLLHCDKVFAWTTGGTPTLTVIPENWAD